MLYPANETEREPYFDMVGERIEDPEDEFLPGEEEERETFGYVYNEESGEWEYPQDEC